MAQITVNSTADNLTGGDGLVTLREAIIAANTDTTTDLGETGSGADTIVLPAGTFQLALAGTGEDAGAIGDLDIIAGSDITIQGNAAGSIINGSGIDRVLHVLANGTLTLENATVTGGSGEGIRSSGSLNITNATISGNGGDGIAKTVATGSLTITNATISGNSGDGISNAGPATISDTTISGNDRRGIFNRNLGTSDTLTITNTTISGHTVTGNGAGILQDANGTINIVNSTISGNEATGNGGGIYNQIGTINIINSTISGNTATGNGGGIYSSNGTITNSTIFGNTAGNGVLGNGGGIYSAANVNVNNSIIAGNSDGMAPSNPDVSGTFTSNGANIIGDPNGSSNFGADTTNVMASTVINTTLADNGGPTQTHALVPGSPAIDAGNNANAMGLTDQRGTGFSRIFNTIVDIGAYEAQQEIDIQGGTPLISIASGDTTPATADDTDFGTTNVAGGTVVKTFTIANTNVNPATPVGDITLTGTPLVSIGGTNAADFTVTTTPASSIAPGNTTTFQITFDPSATGTRTATIRIDSNDGDEGTYTFAVQGMGTAPEIDVADGGTNIADGTRTAQDFGSTTVGGTLSKTFTINNTGNDTLNLSSLSLPTGFTGTLPTTIAAGANATFTVNVDTSEAGILSGTLQFVTDDPDENPFDFAISATVTGTEIQVLDGSTDIADGTTAALNFGSTTVGGNLSKTFTINNTGTETLNLSNLSLPTGFTGTLPTTVAAGGSTTFTVNVDTSAAASLSGTLQFVTDDPNENPFDFAISATVNSDSEAVPESSPLILPTTESNTESEPNTALNTEPEPNTNTESGDTSGGGTIDIDCPDCTCDPLPPLPEFSFNAGEPNPAKAGDDTLIGTEDDDFLAGSTGNDRLQGENGSDILIGGNGNLNPVGSESDRDTIFGNRGDDLLQGSEGEDVIYAGQDNDMARGGKDSDLIHGDIGNDTIGGDLGDDRIFGGSNNPAIGDAGGQDLLYGNSGNDILYGNEGNDSISGGEGNDTVRGGKDDDLLHGDAGDDMMFGDNGSDRLCGGDGNDSIFGGNGSNGEIGSVGERDTLCGGAGNDLLNGNEGQDKLDGGTGEDTLRGGKDSDTLRGGEGSDVLWGDLGNDSLVGGNGSDIFVLSANGGSDIVADFTDGTDLIGLAEGLTFDRLSFTSVNNSTVISIDSNVIATLSNLDVRFLGAADFIVVS